MIKKTFPLNLLLLFSLALAAAGLYMADKAYKTEVCVLAAANQMEFFSIIPELVKEGDSLPLPSYTDIPFLKENPGITGRATGVYYNGKGSIRQVTVSAAFGGDRAVALTALLDARGRQ